MLSPLTQPIGRLSRKVCAGCVRWPSASPGSRADHARQRRGHALKCCRPPSSPLQGGEAERSQNHHQRDPRQRMTAVCAKEDHAVWTQLVCLRAADRAVWLTMRSKSSSCYYRYTPGGFPLIDDRSCRNKLGTPWWSNQRLGLCTPNARGLGSILGQGTRSHMLHCN